jgi:hypothetical protein
MRTAPWDTPYGHAILKIERANQHIHEFGDRIFASSDRYGPTLNMDLQTGEKFLCYSLEDFMLRGELASIAGDAIHNLRSALDIAWLEIVREAGGTITSSTHFPIRADQPKRWLEGVLTAKTTGIDPCSKIYDFLVNHVKGYKGGDADILAIHALDIDDKHRLLLPMLTVTGVTGIEIEGEDGTIDTHEIVLRTHRDSCRRPVPLGSKLKNHGEVHFQITFGPGTTVEGREILPTLSIWHDKVWELIRWLQRLK